MANALDTSLPGLAAVLVLMTLVWLASLAKRDASIVDVFWGLGFVVLAWLYFARGPREGARQLLVPILVSLWGLRLAAFIAWRNRGQGEDYRYAAMRDKYGSKFRWLSLPMVFWLQAVLLWVIQPAATVCLHEAGWTFAFGLLMMQLCSIEVPETA